MAASAALSANAFSPMLHEDARTSPRSSVQHTQSTVSSGTLSHASVLQSSSVRSHLVETGSLHSSCSDGARSVYGWQSIALLRGIVITVALFAALASHALNSARALMSNFAPRSPLPLLLPLLGTMPEVIPPSLTDSSFGGLGTKLSSTPFTHMQWILA